MSFSSTPGPGFYNLSRDKKSFVWKPIPVICFYKGAELCLVCGEVLLGDYYKGDGAWCHPCYRKLLHPEHIRVIKVRHCSFFHKHIGVENITLHKTTLKRVKALELKEKIMRLKFGEMVDTKGKPI